MGKKQKAATKAAASNKAEGNAAAGGKATTAKQQKSRRAQLPTLPSNALERELAAVGLRVKRIQADGNCLFRAAADQVHGDEARWAEVRQATCDVLDKRRAEFEPFVDEGYDGYVARMRRDGTWGGHVELQALALALRRDVLVYQAGQPRWAVRNGGGGGSGTGGGSGCGGGAAIHLAYEDGEHYNSVRLADDYSAGPARPILLADGGATAAQHARERAAWTPADEACVAESTACDNLALVRRALAEAGGDVDAAIEQVIAVMADGDEGGGDAEAAGDDAQASTATAAAVAENGNLVVEAAVDIESKPSAEALDSKTAAAAAAAAAEPEATQPEEDTDTAAAAATSKKSSSGSSARAKKGIAVGSASVTVKPARNKACACGSGKKYKSCCGPAAAAAQRRKDAVDGNPTTTDDAGLPLLVATLHI